MHNHPSQVDSEDKADAVYVAETPAEYGDSGTRLHYTESEGFFYE